MISKRTLAAAGLALLYILMSVWNVRNGRWPPVQGALLVASGILLGLGVALAGRKHPRGPQTSRPAPEPLPDAAFAALQAGNPIAAIKILREQRKLGLKEAKDIVDGYVQEQPALQRAIAATRAREVRKALLVLAVVAALALVVCVFLRS